MAPSTPTTIGVQAFPSPSPTGNWRHPRSDEINKRLQESTFSERNVRQILWRSSSLVVLFVSHKLNGVLHWLSVISSSGYFQKQPLTSVD